MATASELISNQGNPELGGGGIANTSVLPQKTDFDVVNKAGENAMLLSAQRGAALFQQKIKDRDALYALLASGQVQAGDIMKEDKSQYDKVEKGHQEAYKKIRGINDQDAINEYIESSTRLKDFATHLQARKISVDKYKEAIREQPNVAVRNKMEEELKKELAKPVDEVIDPPKAYWQFDAGFNDKWATGAMTGGSLPQESTDKNLVQTSGATTPTAALGGGGSNTSTQTTITKTKQGGKADKVVEQDKQVAVKNPKGVNAITGNIENGIFGLPVEKRIQVLHFNTIDNTAKQIQYSLKDEPGKYHMDYLFNAVQNGGLGGQQETNEYLNTLVKAVKEYAAQTGDNKNLNLGYVAEAKGENGEIKTPEISQYGGVANSPSEAGKTNAIAFWGDDGKLHLRVSASRLASLDALAKAPAFVSRTEDLRLDIADELRKNKESNGKIKSERALANERNARARLLGKQEQSIKNPEEAWDEILHNKITSEVTKNNNAVSRVNRANLSQEFLETIPNVAPINEQGDYNVVPENIVFNGHNLTEDEVYNKYNKWVKEKYKDNYKQNKEIPTIVQFLSLFGEGQKLSYDIALEGKRALTTKQEKIYDPVAREYKFVDKITNPKDKDKLVRANKLYSFTNQFGKPKGFTLMQGGKVE